MAKSKEYELAIKIAGEIEKSFYSSTKLTKKELQEIVHQSSLASNSIGNSFAKGFELTDKGFDKLSDVASKTFDIMTTAATAAAVAIAAIVTASAMAGIEFESAFAGVKKTTDATLAEYEAIRQGILGMANVIPATASEIAEVAESAGQLGIAKENLLDFTRVMIDLGESTNLTATDGASQLAKFANITKMSADKYSNLGSTIVALGNNFATTESDIVSMATRLAASGELTGLTESQILALAASMSSVGIEADAGGSAMSKLLKTIMVSVETGDGLLKEFASVAGMTSKDFKKAFQKDAISALSSFIDGLNDTERNGKSAIAVLDKMGLTEIRLSNMILSLSNASGVMTDAIELSNDAWEENTALAKEAGQRYATTESKISMLKNRITGIGIQIYDELTYPFSQGIDSATNFTKILSDTVVPNILNAFQKKLPTAIRKTKEFTEAFIEFADPLISLGTWVIKHPDVITSMLTGIGGALIAYKVADGIRTITKTFSTLGLILTNPFALAITAVALAIGGAAGIATYVKQANDKMKKQNLAAHFGEIALSIEELGDVAKFIVKNDYLGKLSESITAFEEMNRIKQSIDDSIKSINKMNWKVSIGMELTEDEQQAYVGNVTDFINGTQELLLQKQYALNLTLDVLTSDDEKGQGIQEVFNNFYTKNYNLLTEEGEKLGKVVADALSDGMLDIDEVTAITEMQAKMARITEKLAGSKFAAQLEVLQLKYAGGELDAESFQNLQTEIAKQIEIAVAQYDEALQISIASAQVMLDEGEIDTKAYEEMVQEFKKNYLEQVGDIELRAANFQFDTIVEQYSEELGTVIPELKSAYEKAVNESMEQVTWDDRPVLIFDSLFQELSDSEYLDKTTRASIGELFKKLEPTIEQIDTLKEKYKKYGVAIPQSIQDGMNDMAILGALAKDSESIWKVIGNEATKSKEYESTIENLQKKGWYVPESIGKAMEEKKGALSESAKTVHDYLGKELYNLFLPGYDFDIPLNVTAKVNTDNLNVFKNYKAPLSKYNIPAYAEGGIINSPTLATFAEYGPEAAIPLDGSKKAINLWKTAGRILGVYTESSNESLAPFGSKDTGENISFSSLLKKWQSQKSDNKEQKGMDITYNPTINFYGGTPTKEDILEAELKAQEEFDKKMEYWLEQNNRLSFSN